MNTVLEQSQELTELLALQGTKRNILIEIAKILYEGGTADHIDAHLQAAGFTFRALYEEHQVTQQEVTP